MTKPLTLEERIFIEKLLRQGVSCGEISRRLNRGKNTVVYEVRRYGGRDTYIATQAEAASRQKMVDRYEKLSKMNLGHKYNLGIKFRLENLEMQMEIVIETLNKMRRNEQED